MIPARFDYHRPDDLDEAIRLLGELDGAKALAGGHSLLPMMKLRLAQPSALVDIGRIDALSGVSESADSVRIGATTTHAELAAAGLVRQHAPLLVETVDNLADVQVRNRGTVGGNLAHADPASDLPAAVLALDARLRLKGPDGDRQVDASDFFIDLFTTDIRPGEILTAVDVPKAAAGTGAAYVKFEHPASGYAIVGAAALVTMDGGTCAGARLCFNGISVTPHDVEGLGDALAGGPADDAAIAASLAGLNVQDPLGDRFASAAYRMKMAAVFGARAIARARDRASG